MLRKLITTFPLPALLLFSFVATLSLFPIHAHAAVGDYTGTSFDTAASGNGSPFGITWDGTYFWVTDTTDDEVYRYNANGTYSSFSFDTAASGNGDPYGITWDGTYFWVTDTTDAEVYKYQTNGTYTGTHFDTNASGNAFPTGITWDGTYFWVTDDLSSQVYRYNANGTYSSFSFATAASGNPSPSGITWDGTYFWVTDTTDDEVYKYQGTVGTFPPLVVVAPTVTTNSASAPTPTAATLFASITNNGGSDATQTGFAYGTSANLSTVIATTTLGSFSGTGTFNGSVGLLSGNTTYYYRAYATNSGGTGYGSILNFTTPSSRATLSKPPNNLGLVGYWSFDDGTGEQAGDFSGFRNTGMRSTVGAGLPQWITGRHGKALDFDADDFVEVPYNSVYSVTYPVTVTAVIKLRSISGCYGVVNEGLGAIEGWQVEICNNGHLEWDGVTGVDSTNVIEAGKYYFVAISNTSATSRLFYAVDLSDGSVDVNQVDTTNISVPVNADRPLRIGVYTFSNGTNTDYFNGSVDDVRIYNRALSAGEIAKLYQSGAVKFSGSSVALQNGSSLANGLVGLWTFDGGDTHWTSETTGTTDDRSGAGNTGTLTNMNRRTSVDGGKLGQALTFNGSSSYVETSQSQAVTSSISMSAWIKADDLNRKQVIVNQNTDGAGLELVNDGGAIGEVNFYTGDGGGVNFNETGAYTGSLPTLSPGVWYHIVGVFDDAANTITLYLNGQVYDSDTANFAHNTAATTFRIGQAGTWIGEADYFSGSIDDVRIYNRALTAAEVKQLYLLGGVKVK